MICRIYQTPKTRLQWRSLEEWYEAALKLETRRSSRASNERRALHIAALPLALIDACSCEATLSACYAFLERRQPPRGKRADAPHTALIVAINNRLSLLDRTKAISVRHWP